jgi:hypothetical protein
MQVKALIPPLFLSIALPIVAGAATWVNPPLANEPQGGNAPASPVVAPQSRGATAPPPRAAAAPAPQPTATTSSQSDLPATSGVTVEQWGFSPAAPGRPVYLTMTFAGTQAAIDRMRSDRPLTVEVQWAQENGGAASGAPNLVTELTIGRPGLAAALEGDVRRRGYFEWHSWARKDNLSPGRWTVSVTDGDGQPLLCGQQAQPCRFTLDVG